MKKALITGITGQDGSYLAELLLEKGYEVHGIKRRASSINTARIDHLYSDPHEENARLVLHYGDMTDGSSLQRTIQQVQPDEIYNLAAQSHVAVSFEEPEYTAESDAVGTLRLLEAIRNLGLENKCRFYQASTSELFAVLAGGMACFRVFPCCFRDGACAQTESSRSAVLRLYKRIFHGCCSTRFIC